MSELDKKLEEILDKSSDYWICDEYHIHSGKDANSDPDDGHMTYDDAKVIRDIKQAFIDAGWSDNPFYFDSKSESLKKKLTGQEWYDRFEREMKSVGFYPVMLGTPFKAAKKAAGIEQ